MIPELGHFALILALLVALVQGIVPLIGAQRRDAVLIGLAKPAARAQFFLVALAFGCLAWSFATSDFSVVNVAQHSNTQLPLQYRIAATWGSHEGSLLLWVLMLTGWATAVTLRSRNLPDVLLARVLAVMGLVSVGFLMFLLFTSNPFLRLVPAAAEGSDLNPLLQDPGMVIHPPMLYMGYVGFSVAFAFAIAALLGGRLDATWARWSRPWTTAAWSFLTIGIALGSWWAYYELGWGGWWFWDPVENASFMPWLVGTALIHSLAVTEKRGLFKSWTLLLAIIQFSLSLVGTFLVRSGVLVSVHSFASDPSRGLFILGFLGVAIGGSLALYAWRGPAFRTRGGFDVISRESFLMFNNVLLVVTAALILIGTLYPLFLDAMNLGKISVGPPYFNFVFLIPTVPLLFLLAVGMHAKWKKGQLGEMRGPLTVLGVGAAIFGLLVPVVAYGSFHVMSAIGLSAGVWVILSSLWDPIQRWRKKQTLSRGLLGMSIAHIGVGLFAIGVTVVQMYKIEKDIALKPGESYTMQGYEFRFNGTKQIDGPNYVAMQSEVAITKEGKTIAVLHPQKRVYRVQKSPMTEAGLEVDWNRDLFVAMGEDLGNGSWSLRLQYKPMVRFIWLGAVIMALGGLLAITDRRFLRQRSKAAEKIGAPGTAKAT